MADTKVHLEHTAGQVDEHIVDSNIHVTTAEKSNWNDKYSKEEADAAFLGITATAAGASKIVRENIAENSDLNTLDMGEGTKAADYKLFVATTKSVVSSVANLPPDFPNYNGFAIEYLRIHGQQWLQRLTGATYSSTGDVYSMRVYYRAGVGVQPNVVWGGWFYLSPTACETTAAVSEAAE